MTANMPFSCLLSICAHSIFTVWSVFSAVLVRLSRRSVVSPGVGVIAAPVHVTARFKEPLTVPGRVTITFWERTKHQGGSSSAQELSFHMEQHGGHKCHMMGLISRS